MEKHKISKGGFSQKFSEFIVKKRWYFFGLFIALTIVCCCLIPQTKVVYDLSGYLPKKSDANQAMEVLKTEFDDKGMAYVMVSDISKEDATALAAKLGEIEGVANVTFTATDIDYKNGNALYTVSLSSYDSTKECFATIESIINYLDDYDGVYLTGQSAYSYFTKQETFESILTIGIVIVLVILLMILLTSKTYFEILVMVVGFGIAVALNMGTNFLFVNGISYVSNLVALVLQLALSIDYSVILLHRFMEERELNDDAKAAAVTTLKKSIPEILSSSLTTIAGLCSLMLMTLPIGVEMGISLAKGIVFSLITVIFFLPGLLVISDKPLQKSVHKPFIPKITRPARAIVKARKVIVPVFLILVILSGVGQFKNTYAFNMNGGSKIVTAKAGVEEGGFGTLNSLVIIVPKGDYQKQRELAEYVQDYEIIDSCTALSTIQITNGVYLTDSYTKSELQNLFNTLTAGVEGAQDYDFVVSGIFDYYVEQNNVTAEDPSVPLIDLIEFAYSRDTYRNLLHEMAPEYEALLAQLVYARNNLESDNYARMTFNINSGIESADTFKFIKDLKAGVGDYYDEVYMTGESVVCYDMAEFFPKDNLIVSLCTIFFVLFILLITFRNIALPLILILAIQGGIWINFVIPYLSGTSISFIAYLLITAMQMGATIDYGIVLTNRYRTIRKDYDDRLDAMAAAENAVFPTIITSGVILTVTGFTLGLAASGVVAQMGMLLGVGALTSVLVVLFVLPSLLLVTEKFDDKTDFKKLFHIKRNKDVAPDVAPEPVNDAEEKDDKISA